MIWEFRAGSRWLRNLSAVFHRSASPARFVVWAALAGSLAFATLFVPKASAHDVPQSESKIQVQGHNVKVLLKLDLLELGYVDVNGDNVISYDELDSAIDRIYADVRTHYSIRSTTALLQVTLQRYEIVEDHVLELNLLYVFAGDVTQVEVDSTLFQIMRLGHQHLTSVDFGEVVNEGILDARNRRVVFTATGISYRHTIASFLLLGIEHIFTGYDHLAFLVGLLIVTNKLGSLIKVLTSFTIAHSITLSLATFNLVVLPSRLTESMIPLTIAYVAIENLSRQRAIERYQVTFLFGLIHGFGFSNVLREMQLSRGHLALSLFSFNAGVEVGQLAFVIALYPLIYFLASTFWRLQVRSAVSAIVLCLAVYWFVQRAFLV
jgi:HupE / UreJ protein